MDGVKPDIRLEVRKYAPKTYAEAKSLARNLEAALNEKLRKTVTPAVAVVGDVSLVGSLEHQLSALQAQFNASKRSSARIELNNFRSRNFPTSFSRNTATMRKRTFTRNLVCYKCRQKGHIARRCRSTVGNLDSYNSFSHSTQNRDSQFKFQPQPQRSVDSLSPDLLDTNTFLFRVYFTVHHLMH